MYFGIVYIPAESFQYISLKLFDDLENSILDFSTRYEDCSFCICGDFNAKSDHLSDFSITYEYVTDNIF